MKKLFLLLVILLSISTAFTQSETSDTTQVEEKTNFIVFQTDFVSRFIWRGQTLSDMPNLQPALLYSTPKFDVGFLGSTSLPYNVDGPNWNEFDLFVEYRPLPMIGFKMTDFYFQGIDSKSNKYFDYGKNTTGHYFVGDILLYLGENVDEYGSPYNTLTFDFSTVLYGNDKVYYYDTEKISDSTENAYSTYVDVTYNYKNKLIAFIGMTPDRNFYNMESDKAAIVNIGFRYNVMIPITEKFNLPVFATIVTNPNTEKVYFVCGLTLLNIN